MELTIVSPDGQAFSGSAQKLFCRTICGDVGILPRHSNYCTPVGMGEARVTDEDGNVRRAACIGGVLTVMDGKVLLAANTFEWEDEIDLDRAKSAMNRAKEKLAQSILSPAERDRFEAKLHRAEVRISVADPESDN